MAQGLAGILSTTCGHGDIFLWSFLCILSHKKLKYAPIFRRETLLLATDNFSHLTDAECEYKDKVLYANTHNIEYTTYLIDREPMRIFGVSKRVGQCLGPDM